MPTLVRFGSIAVRMFADDHNPPHFHVVTPNHEAMVSLANLEVIEGTIDRRSLEIVHAWASDNRAFLQETWRRLNVR